jgi:transposase
MYIKVTRSGPHRYLQVVEAYRDADSGQPRQRHIATLGRLDQLSAEDLDGLIDGLLKATDRPDYRTLSQGIEAAQTTFESALQLGDVWVLSRLWRQLNLAEAIRQGLTGRRHRIAIEQLIRVMVFNRLSDPCSKRGVVRWLERVHLPGIEREAIGHQQLLRAMDALIRCKDTLEAALATTLQAQYRNEMTVLFYDITTVGVEGEVELDGDLRCYGYAKGGGVDRQFAVGVVQTAEGLPITHEVFEGNVSEAGTVRGIVERLCERFPIRRLVLVADRGMLSLENLALLETLALPDGRTLEYIVAVPARRHQELTAGLEPLHGELVRGYRQSGQEQIREVALDNGRRLVVAFDAERARLSRVQRKRRLREVVELAQRLEHTLTAQDAGESRRGRPLTDHGAKLQLHQRVLEHRLSAVIEVDQHAALFSWGWNGKALRRLWRQDGKRVLITNVADLDAATVVKRYQALADIERGFRVLKSELTIAPVDHRLPARIRAHTLLCFLALVLHRVLRQRLARLEGPAWLSPGRALETLQTLQRHEVRLSSGQRLRGISPVTPAQQRLLQAIQVEVPTEQRLARAL